MPQDLPGTLRYKLFSRDDFVQATKGLETSVAWNVALHPRCWLKKDSGIPLKTGIEERKNRGHMRSQEKGARHIK
jgi:hypothetical protein